MLETMIILLCGGAVLGFLWRRKLPSVLGLSLLLALGFGTYLGDWSFVHSFSYFWRNLIYMAVTIGGYFAMIVVPAIAGVVAGYFLREGICRRR